MTDNGFYDVFKCSLESMKEKSISSLLATDSDYQNHTNQQNIAEEQYMALNLSVEQREVVDQLIDARDKQNINLAITSVYRADALAKRRVYTLDDMAEEHLHLT